MGERASFDLKIDRAEKHLIDLEREAAIYSDSHPYGIATRYESKRKPHVHRLTLATPDPMIALIASDFLYNIRSGLDHLAVAIVPWKHRASIGFPIFWQGVWEEDMPGENQQRLKDRARWRTYTKHMPDEAVALLKQIQPPDIARHIDNTHALAVLNALRNNDAHTKLPQVDGMLLHPYGSYVTEDGTLQGFVPAQFGVNDGLSDGAEINGIPRSAVNLKLEGTPVVVVRFGQVVGGYDLANGFRDLLYVGAREAIDAFRPYVLS